LINEFGALRDERAGLLFLHILRTVGPRAFPGLYLAAIEGLGTIGGPDAIDALLEVLYRGDLFSPLQTRRTRGAAAHALRRIGTADALDGLRQAASRGSWGVRSAARRELAHVRTA
jgi:HEAT repeat protein